MKRALSDGIKTAFRLVREFTHDSEYSRRIDDALLHARDGERQHRRGVPSGYDGSASDAARYFVVKWFYEGVQVRDARDACRFRKDAIHAGAARLIVEDRAARGGAGGTPGKRELRCLLDAIGPIAKLDYSEVFAKGGPPPFFRAHR